jgi:hypothetical protein
MITLTAPMAIERAAVVGEAVIEGKVFEVLEYAVRYDGWTRPVTCFESERIGSGYRCWIESGEMLEPWCGCDDCMVTRPSQRAEWRTLWREIIDEEGRLLGYEDVTTRKMRDLNSRLNLYRYGDHHWQPEVMQAVTAKQQQDAFTAIPQTKLHSWPIGDRIPRGSTEERPSNLPRRHEYAVPSKRAWVSHIHTRVDLDKHLCEDSNPTLGRKSWFGRRHKYCEIFRPIDFECTCFPPEPPHAIVALILLRQLVYGKWFPKWTPEYEAEKQRRKWAEWAAKRVQDVRLIPEERKLFLCVWEVQSAPEYELALAATPALK